MALTFPLSPAEWMDLLAVQDVTFNAPPQTGVSQTGAGEFIPHQLGPTLWRGSAVTRNFRYDCGASREIMLSRLQEPGASFLVYNKRKQFPKEDPGGLILGASTPTLYAVHAARDQIELAGLPALYSFTAGDYLSFTYGTNPVRYALHQVVQSKDANGPPGPARSGWLDIWPRIRPGYTLGAAVTLIKPVCKAIIVPGSVSEGVYGPVAMTGLSFRWQQTLR